MVETVWAASIVLHGKAAWLRIHVEDLRQGMCFSGDQ